MMQVVFKWGDLNMILECPNCKKITASTRHHSRGINLLEYGAGCAAEEEEEKIMKQYIEIKYYALPIALLASILSLCASALADQNYNPITKQYEIVTPNSTLNNNSSANRLETVTPNSTLKYNPSSNRLETVSPQEILKYNPYANKWGYSAPNAIPTYNPHQNTWDMAPPDYQLKYNPMTGKWERASPESKLKYNPVNHEWKYVP